MPDQTFSEELYDDTALKEAVDRMANLIKTHATKLYVDSAVEQKQDKLTFDSTPTAGSTKPVTSGGIKAAVDSVDTEIGELKENLREDVLSVENAFDTEEHTPLNLLDRSAIETGCYYWTNGKNTNASYNATGLIPVASGETLYFTRGYQTVTSGRAFFDIRFVVGYDADGTTVKDSARSVEGSVGYTVPDGVSYVRLSSSIYLAPADTYTMIQTVSQLIDFTPYFEPYTSKILKAECNNDPHIQSIVNQTIENADGKLIFSATSDSLAANTNLICCNSCCNKKNEYIVLTANFSTFDELTIAHGKGSYMGGYITITATKIQCRAYDGTLYEEFEHGLTMSDFINVVIYTKNDSNCRSKITIMTAGGDYTAETTRYYACRAAVLCNATFAMTNVKMQYVVNDGKEDVWVFGDSYISCGDPNRWATQLVSNGHKNLLLCGFGGAMSGNMIVDFRLMLSVIKPKFLCWFLGMNDGDGSSAVNTNWKTYVDEVIATCDAEGITLILATIPNVPNVINTFKNAYVKASGKRYVDFAKVVNGESTGATWYTGMLSSDNTHPTALGAKALMRQFILDVPEVLYSEE